jgi:crossover junction endodeoxyribonuclease RusA
MLVVLGKPVPQGSKRVFNGHVVEVNSVALNDWRREIRQSFAALGREPALGPVCVTLDFFFARPAGHYGKKGLRPSAPSLPGVRPDLDKLVRAVLDALTGVAFRDDAQVVTLVARKHYADEAPPGLVLEVEDEVPSGLPATLRAERSV